MRKASVRATALLMAGGLALAGCASDDNDSDSSGSGGGGGGGAEGEVKIGLAYDTGGRGDKSFNDSAFAGASAAAESLDAELLDLSPNADASNRADLLTQLADDGFNPIIAVGFAYADTLAEVAPQYPDVTFAIVDSAVEGTGLDNATGLLFASEQGSFLGGVAAALKSETNHIGFVGGVDVPLIQTFQAGYEQGARAVNPDIVIDVQYISPAGDFSGFNAPERANDIAGAMFAGGADIVYHAAGGSGQGVFEAAAAAGGLAIGVDSDQYETVGDANLQSVILTSVLKRVDVAVQGFIEDFEAGDVEGGTDIVNDLSTEGLDLATSGGQIDDIQTQIDDYRQQIIDGEIEVSSTP
jgi:basic membrane protein A